MSPAFRHLLIGLTTFCLVSTGTIPSRDAKGDEPKGDKWARYESLCTQTEHFPEHSKDGFSQLSAKEQDAAISRVIQSCDLYQQYSVAADCLKLPKLSKFEFLQLGDQQTSVASKVKQQATDWLTYKDRMSRVGLPFKSSQEFGRFSDQARKNLLADLHEGAVFSWWTRLLPWLSWGLGLVAAVIGCIFVRKLQGKNTPPKEDDLNKCPHRTSSVSQSASDSRQASQEITPPSSAAEASSSTERHCDWNHVKSDFNHCDNLVHARLNTFFVAQAFLFVAFMSNRTSVLPNQWIAFLGVVFTFAYWIAVTRMEATVAALKEEFRKVCPRFASETGPKGNRTSFVGSRLSSYQWLVWVVPFVTFWTWVALLTSSILLAVSAS
jgi:hypothetical protein